MQQICPACNGLINLTVPCPSCGKVMEDQGHVSDLFGPYGPYEEDWWPSGSRQPGVYSRRCIHFLFCPGCKKGTERSVNKVTF